jgi:hypothetical protein
MTDPPCCRKISSRLRTARQNVLRLSLLAAEISVPDTFSMGEVKYDRLESRFNASEAAVQGNPSGHIRRKSFLKSAITIWWLGLPIGQNGEALVTGIFNTTVCRHSLDFACVAALF